MDDKRAQSPIPEAELELLACLEEAGEALASELRERLRAQRPLSHASVMTLLGRLQKRGLVQRRKAETGKAYVYSPTRGALRAIRGSVGRMLERVFHDDKVSLVSTLFGAKAPSQREIDELRELLDRTEANARPKSKPRGKS